MGRYALSNHDDCKAFNRALALTFNQRFREALPILLPLAERYPHDEWVLWCITVAYNLTNQYDKALPYARRTVELMPENLVASLSLYRALERTGDIHNALIEARRYEKLCGPSEAYEEIFDDLVATYGIPSRKERARLREEAKRKATFAKAKETKCRV